MTDEEDVIVIVDRGDYCLAWEEVLNNKNTYDDLLVG